MAFGSVVESLITENKLKVDFKKFGYPDEFIKHGDVSQIEKKYGLDVGSIIECLNYQEKNIKMMKTNY